MRLIVDYYEHRLSNLEGIDNHEIYRNRVEFADTELN